MPGFFYDDMQSGDKPKRIGGQCILLPVILLLVCVLQKNNTVLSLDAG
jgi:hypothetical protein